MTFGAVRYSLNQALSAESLQLIGAMNITPPPTRRWLIDQLILGLTQAEVWARLDGLHVYAASDRQSALLNWRDPTRYNGTEVNAPTFTADVGYTGGGTTYIDTGFNPTTATTPKFVQNDASLFVWSNTVTQDVNLNMAGYPALGGISALPRDFGNGAFMKVNSTDAGNDATVTSTDGRGLFVANRTGSTSLFAWRNTLVGTVQTTASVAPHNANLITLRGNNDFSTRQCCLFGWGSSLTDSQIKAAFLHFSNYLRALGVTVVA